MKRARLRNTLSITQIRKLQLRKDEILVVTVPGWISEEDRKNLKKYLSDRRFNAIVMCQDVGLHAIKRR